MNVRFGRMISKHAAIRAKERGIPPLIVQWLEEFGEEDYDGRGTVRIFFNRRSICAMDRAFGRRPVRRMSEYLDAYIVESVSDRQVITIGHRFKRLWRR
jgi:hypothetical protein